MLGLVLLLVVLVKQNEAVIYSLNESEYNRMPALFALDDYSSCLLDPVGVYCVIDVNLRGDNPLMHMIQEYSDYKVKHYNHTQIHRGVCVTHTCKDYIHNRSLDRPEDLNSVLEGCLNASLWQNYELQGNLANIEYCRKANETTKIDLSDVIVTVVYLVIILLNVVGSFYDVIYCKKGEKSGNACLLAFSARRNWKKLVAPNGGPDPRLNRLKLFHGLRTMTMVCVFFSHTVLVMTLTFVDNPLYIEKSYEDPLKYILLNGSLVTHTFFVMSSFLLAYNFMLHAEKYGVSWIQLPKGIVLRWLRLTPVYMLVLATIATVMRHTGSGPLWPLVVGSEADACRQYWWAHLLYINNYIYGDALCVPQAWYLAADTQLFCVGLLICVVARSARAQKIALSLLFTTALVIAAAHTYFQDLDAVVIQAPESLRNLYSLDDTFRLLYIRGHTNLSTYTLGLAGGFLAYYWQKDGKEFSKYKRYRILYWLMFPAGVGVILSGGLFYVDGSPPSNLFRVVYAMLYKPVFQLLIVILILGVVFKFETVFRRIVEWRAFTWTGRVSYSGFLLHTLFQRGLVGIQTRPTHMTDYYVITVLTSTIFLSFLGAAMMWVCVEAPVGALTKLALAGRAEKTEQEQTKV
ncbi:nose resistant to fluoxetine protein 6-like [Pectinophora gossypiella]|uniref:nose resistant to fluoxetine protein 6-like n=1 Tax=Pectinophora gossypiella TaxID=13191 RepID=UPI00214EC19B|nr:nose resistant to fluoxetine protein 6-like [Pectinophora gossypiella]